MYPRRLLYTTLGLTICLLCQSSFQCPGKNNTARSPTKLHHDAGVSILATTSLVQPTAQASNLRHHCTPTGSTNLPPMGPLHSTSTGSKPGSLYGHHLHKTFKAQGISERNANHIIDNKSSAFQKTASTQIRKWEFFCLAREIDPSKLSLNDLADYVRFLDKELKTGRSIKKYFNQVEQCLDKDSKLLILNASVKTLLTTVVHNKPSLPTLPGEIWDADRLITHLSIYLTITS